MRSPQETYEEAKSYQISYEPELPLLPDGFTQDDLEECQTAAFHGPKAALHEVKRTVAKYPEVPCLWNYLAAGHRIRKEPKKARKVEIQLFERHPDYFFAKIAEATARCETNRAESMPEILGESLTLREALGHERAPHQSEWKNFYHTLAHYYIKTGHLEHAAKILQALQEEPESRDVATNIKITLGFARFQHFQEKISQASARRIRVNQGEIPKIKKRLPRPDALLPEVEELYEHGIELPKSTIDGILALPREISIPALRQVLLDSIANGPYHYHSSRYTEDNGLDFGLHALFLLSEMKAVEARPEVFKFLGQHEEILSESFGDFISWQPLTGFLNDNLEEVAVWLTSPGLSYLGRSYLTEALAVVANNQRELREPALLTFRTVLQTLRDGSADDGILDTNLVSSMLGDLMDMRAIECKDLFCELYEKELVNESMIGSLEEALAELEKPPEKPKPLVSMANFYRGFKEPATKPLPLRQSHPFPTQNEPFGLAASKGPSLLSGGTPPKSEFEPSRNAPCPCGSGKKYKKCCLH